MTTLTLRPILNGTYREVGGDYANIDEEVADDSTTKNYFSGSSYALDTFILPRPQVAGPISNVAIYQRSNGSGAYVKPAIYTHGAIYYGGEVAQGSSYVTTSYSWSVNPYTGAAWTWAEIASLQAGIAMKGSGGVWNTQLYIVVDYTAFTYSEVTIRPNASGDLSDLGSDYTQVDEASPDDNSTYVYGTATQSAYRCSVFGMETRGIAGLIGHIYGKARFKASTGSANAFSAAVAIRTHGTTYYGPFVASQSTTWVEVDAWWGLNPYTGAAWTQAELDAVQIGLVTYGNTSPAPTAYITQVYGAVGYAANNTPNAPSTPSGATVGSPGVSYSFSTSGTDPDENSIQYTIDWGDESESTSDSVASGQSVNLSHSWAQPGTYSVKAKTTDSFGAISGWSGTLTIVIAASGSYARAVGLF
jgi:hypothetical protein